MDARPRLEGRPSQRPGHTQGAPPPQVAALRAGVRGGTGVRGQRRRARARRQAHHGRGGRVSRARGAGVRAHDVGPQRRAARHHAASLAAAGLPGRHAAHADQPARRPPLAARADQRKRVGNRRALRPRGRLLPGGRGELRALQPLPARGDGHGAGQAARERALGAVRVPLHGLGAGPDPVGTAGQRTGGHVRRGPALPLGAEPGPALDPGHDRLGPEPGGGHLHRPLLRPGRQRPDDRRRHRPARVVRPAAPRGLCDQPAGAEPTKASRC